MRAAAGPLQAALAKSAAGIDRAAVADAAPWLDALGGRENVLESGSASSRVWLRVADDGAVDEGKLMKLGVRTIARPSADTIHLLLGDAEAIAAALQPA